MALSGALAFLFPFELFLFSWIVLSPLHDLTEISWLHERGYYTRGGGRDAAWLFGAGCVIFAFHALGVMQDWTAPLTGAAFLAALSFFAFQDRRARIAGALAALPLAYGLSLAPGMSASFAMLPGLIHVFVFTALFILAGALKSRSFAGVLSVVVFFAIGAALLFWHPERAYQASEYARGTFRFGVSRLLLELLGVGNLQGDALFQHPAALAAGSFLAYGFTYHYLNWFSKTSVIGWHEMPRSRAALIVLAWLACVGVCAYDYSIGLLLLVGFGLQHVLLEFPLVFATASDVGRGLSGAAAGLAGPARPSASRG